MTTTAIQAAAGSQTGKNGSAASGAAAGAPLVLVGAESGITLIPQPTELTRLNYYDGKFLRAADLNAEQGYLRSLVALSNRAGGAGVVHGFDVTNAGTGTLALTAGLAIDPRGRVVWMPYDATVNLAQLIERSREAAAAAAAGPAAGGESFAGCAPETVSAAPGGTGLQSTDLYLITVSWVEALCGEADVYGKLCEDACVTSTDRPFRLEGLVVRAVPVSLGAAPCTAPWLDARHRRSLVASAWFADERAAMGAAMSGARIRNGPWCVGATAATGDSVPLAVVSVSGSAVQFLDEWTARRERMETPPLRYWQWQLAMRPKAVFLAQLLQFQCQLRDVLTAAPLPESGGNDPCGRQRDLLKQAEKMLAEVQQQHRALAEAAKRFGGETGEKDVYRPEFLTALGNLKHEVGATLTQLDAVEMNRVLLEGGIVELPPAGYLPVAPGPVDVKTQVQRLLGEGVELRVCAVRPDFVPHALEEAQHMERICLVQGLVDPDSRPKVDVLVPDGLVTDATVSVGGIPLQVKLRFESIDVNPDDPDDLAGDVLTVAGAARAEALEGGGAAFHFAGRGELVRQPRDDRANVHPAPEATPAAGTGMAPAKDPALTNEVAADGAGLSTAEAREMIAKARRAEAPAETARARPRASLTGDGLRRMFTRTQAQPAAPQRGGIVAFQSPTQPPAASPPHSPPWEEPETADFSPSVWASVRVGGDPFALAVGDSVPLHGEFAMSFEEGGSPPTLTAAELVVDAELYRDQGSGSTLTGRARGFAVVRAPGHAPESGHESFPVELSIQQNPGGGGTLTVTVDALDEQRLRFVTTWEARPTRATMDGDVDWIEAALARLGSDKEDTAARARIGRWARERPELRHVPFLHAEAVENAEVLKAGNAHHERAVAALADLQELLKEPGFRAAAEARLFAPDRQVEAASSVRATKDWVLFHRRRDNSCDCTCAHDATQVIRRYRVFHARVAEGATVAEIRQALAAGREIPGTRTLPVVPKFAADAAAVLSTRREVLDAWREMDLGTEIVYGAVAAAGVGSADPGALLDARLEALGALVDDMTPAPRAVYETLPTVPTSLSAGGVDGVMLLVTQARPPKTHCHRVYALREATMDRALRQIREGARLQDTLDTDSTDLGTAEFLEGSGTPAPGGLKGVVDAFRTRFPDAGVAQAVTVFPGASVPAWAAPEGEAILKALGGTLTEGALATAEALSVGCPAFTLLKLGDAPQPATVCHALYRLKPGWTMPRLGKLDEAGRVAQSLSDIAWELGVVRFQEGTHTPVSDVSGLKAKWQALAPGAPEFGATFSTAAQGSTEIGSQMQQGMVLNQAMGGPQHSNPWPTSQPVSSLCGVATLVAEQPAVARVHRVYRLANPYISPDYAWPVIKSWIAQGRLAEVLTEFPGVLLHLGDVQFYDGTTEVISGDVAAMWAATGGGAIAAVGTIHEQSIPSGWKPVLYDQSRELATLANGTGAGAAHEGVPATGLAPGVGALTMLVMPTDNSIAPSGPTVDCHSVYRFNQALTADGVTRMRKALQEPDGLKRVLENCEPQGTIGFAAGQREGTTGDQAKIKAWGNSVTAALAVVPAVTEATEAELAAGRAEWIAETASGKDITARTAVRVEEELGVECGAVTLLFFG